MKKMQKLTEQLTKKPARLIVLLGLIAALSVACAEPVTPLNLADGYVRMPPPGMKMTAGFGRITNPSGRTVELVGVSSPAFNSVSIHRSQIVDGVAKMREVRRIAIEPGEFLLLEPGGFHFMLMGARQPLTPGQMIPLLLTLGDGTEQILELAVTAPQR